MSTPNAAFEPTDLTYDQVPWYRRRWFLLVTLLLFMPATIGICLTGDIYAKRENAVFRYSKKQRKVIIIIAAVFMTVGLIRGLALG